jgi:MFS family permease
MSTQRRLDLVVAANFLAIGMFLSAIPRYVREELGGTSAQVGLATTIFFLAALFTRPVVGRWMDRIGRRPFLTWPMLAMAVLALVLEGVSSVWAVVLVRIVQGVFGSTFYTASAAVATDIAPSDRRATAVARLSLVIYLGFAIGPWIGEALFDQSPRAVWAVALALHLTSFALSFTLPETLTPRAADAPRPHASIRSLQRIVARPGTAQLTAGLAYACVLAFLPNYARQIGLASSGALFLTFAVSALVVRLFIGRLADAVGYLAVAIPGLALMSFGHLLLAVAWSPWVPFPGVALVGIGFGATFPSLTALSVARSPDAVRGAALGAFLSFNDLGNALAGPAVGAIADAAGFRWSYGVPAIVTAVGVGIAWSMRRDGVPARSA